MEIIPTAAELMLPWRRDRSYHSLMGEEGSEHDNFDNDNDNGNKRLSKESEGETRVTTPTVTETQLPWKRDDEDDAEGGVQQHEFPAWASNKEYLAYNSPSATFLGGLSNPRQMSSVVGLFRRESSTSGSAAGSDPCLAVQLTAELQASQARAAAGMSSGRSGVERDRRSTICAVTPIDESIENGIDPLGALIELENTGRYPRTGGIHSRSNRRSSLFDIHGGSMPEGKHSKSCPDREAYAARGRASSLLPRLTPRTQLRQMHSQATSLLSSTSSFTDTSDDDDEGEELHSYNENKPRRHHYP